MEVKRISYNGTAADEIYRWLNHVVEEVIFQHLQADACNYVDLKTSKHVTRDEYPQLDNPPISRE